MKLPISRHTVLVAFLFITSVAHPEVAFSQATSKFIVVDQFGYRPTSEKIAILRDPAEGFDSSDSFAPGNLYSLVNANTNVEVYSGNPIQWNGGNIDPSSGDRAWWFDFSSYEVPGTYFVLDVENNIKSYDFMIDEHVYAELLKHAVRTFFYQRAGYAKEEEYAGSAWTDEASHIGDLQDTNCRRYDGAAKPSTSRDLSGGWYDAGDYNKYTPWTSNYIVDLLKAYEGNPNAWSDDYCLPHSGNGIADIIDEVKWGLDHLLRLQEPDGSLISVVSLASAAPPSTATGQSLYGGVNTTSTLAAAGAYAYGAKVFEQLGMEAYSTTLLQSAEAAWNWAEDNPNVIWKNNDASFNSVGIGAGQQETDDHGRLVYKIRAAVHLYHQTNETAYRSFVEGNYGDTHFLLWNLVYPFEEENQETLLYFTTLPEVAENVVADIRETYLSAMEDEHNFDALSTERDPYLAYLKDYVWGSNNTKSRKGLLYTDYIQHDINPAKNDEAYRAAERYIHYIHGVNPLNFCYLSNMYEYGADHGVNEFYHTWFADGTDWDRTGTSPYGPPPGFVVGGANPTYDWDNCCTSGGCGSNPCDPEQRARIRNQPQQKAYDDFNTSWPMNSWSVTENSGGYQVGYIRLLSKFVNLTDYTPKECGVETVEPPLQLQKDFGLNIYPNPTDRYLEVKFNHPATVKVISLQGIIVHDKSFKTSTKLNLADLTSGIYVIQIKTDGKVIYEGKVIKTN